jgi:hypothetical protein
MLKFAINNAKLMLGFIKKKILRSSLKDTRKELFVVNRKCEYRVYSY